MIDLKTKQAFWAEQLPYFKEKYWLPNHLEVLKFDMIGGCFEIAEDIKTELSEEDILEIYHRVNSGWAMWKKAVTFMREKAEAQAVPQHIVTLQRNDEVFKFNLLDLLRRSLKSSKVLKTRENWSHVSKMVGLGSTTATLLCIEMNVDPDGMIFVTSESGAEG
ncbi:hypothetical protein [Acinetobacter baumannii]|uniref:hypothetical protein n=1 Tax=Acinetobacter baumannii TaxID=470 RepID=UPI000DE76618|nr:hypothetical protein [Acinetobacter baumannii]MDC4871777.1 hypothetical protein [Acinetobacter baumannii]MDC4945669.1 hypothetical protein [Acinetobacter baumannii]MDC5108756.1 hypothetical protein [Acinetobacter baumannii]MDC5303858.1 hypothetical protein [Acinetobacter baumannii]SSS76919.1 Uncharacterised protein [Acinetobacter baumannii]